MPKQAVLNVKDLYGKLCPACRELLIQQLKNDLVDTQIREQLEAKD